MNRRTLLAAAPAALAAAPASALCIIDPADTPVMRLFRQHQAIMDAARDYTPVSSGKAADEEMDRLFYCRSNKIEEEMMALPCTCAADFAAKVIVDTCCGGLFSDWETGAIWQEARALVG